MLLIMERYCTLNSYLSIINGINTHETNTDSSNDYAACLDFSYESGWGSNLSMPSPKTLDLAQTVYRHYTNGLFILRFVFEHCTHSYTTLQRSATAFQTDIQIYNRYSIGSTKTSSHLIEKTRPCVYNSKEF